MSKSNEVIAELNHKNKRLQEENENLKQQLIVDKNQINYFIEENEELKKKQITKNGFICDCEQNAKYKQALEKIRNLLLQIDENNWLHTGKHIYMDDKCISELKTRIQTIINEVLNDRN